MTLKSAADEIFGSGFLGLASFFRQHILHILMIVNIEK